MTKKLLITFVLFLCSVSLFSKTVSAQESPVYPISELGDCRDGKECYLYCQIPENKAACWSYGEYKLSPQVLGDTTSDQEEKKIMEAKARELGITFPIPELGNCADPLACKTYCSQEANYQTCMAFGKKKGLTKESAPAQLDAAKKQETLQSAQAELGCTSIESCRAICEADHARCEAFARRHGLGRQSESASPTGSDRAKLLEKAKAELGCDSSESCKKVCEQDKERCLEFSRRNGLERSGNLKNEQRSASLSGEPYHGPGGCDSETSCKQYCQDHPSECPGYRQLLKTASDKTQSGEESSRGGTYVGPGGCRTSQECKAYCQSNPDKCPGFSEAQKRLEYYLKNRPTPSSTGTSPFTRPTTIQGFAPAGGDIKIESQYESPKTTPGWVPPPGYKDANTQQYQDKSGTSGSSQ